MHSVAAYMKRFWEEEHSQSCFQQGRKTHYKHSIERSAPSIGLRFFLPLPLMKIRIEEYQEN